MSSDCTLINVQQRFSCCYAGACDVIDYSNPKWKAVNKSWFEEGKQNNCPSIDACGPAPGCPTQVVGKEYVATCIQNKCEKQIKTHCIPTAEPTPEQTDPNAGIDAYHAYSLTCNPIQTQSECETETGCKWVD